MLPDTRKGARRRGGGSRGKPPYVACGLHAAEAFLSARPGDVEVVLATSEGRGRIESAAAAAGRPVESTDPKTLSTLAGGASHQGIAVLGRPPRPWDLTEVLAENPDFLVVLDGLTDPRNVGAVLRSAEATGAGAVVVARDRAPGLTASLVKAAAGAVEWLPIARVTNLVRSLGELRDAGFWVLGLDSEGEYALDDPEGIPGLPAALVLGAEGTGLRPLVRRHCDRLLSIPMRGRTESLNVSVAAGVGLWELSRRSAAGRP